MALFGKKTEEKTEDVNAKNEKAVVKDTDEVSNQKKTKEAPKKLVAARDLSSVIKRPRITEKAVMKTDQNVYTFEVRKDATKYDIRDAVKEFFGVTPIRVNIVNKKTRHYVSRMRGKDMTEKSLKKAYVYLKEGDRIDLV